jgi:hypothetical protein
VTKTLVEQIFCNLQLPNVQPIKPFSFLFPSLSFPNDVLKWTLITAKVKLCFFSQTMDASVSSFTDCISDFVHHLISLAISKKDLSLIIKKGVVTPGER